MPASNLCQSEQSAFVFDADLFSVNSWFTCIELGLRHCFHFVSQMLKLSDEDFQKLGLTTGARRKLRVNLELLRYVSEIIVL